MIKTYKDTLNIGEYGEQFIEYDTNEYVCDIITYIADSNVDIYNYNLWEWAKDNEQWIEEAIAEGLYNIDSRDFDLMALFMAGQYLQITNDLYADLDDIIPYVLLDNLKDDYINVKRLLEVIEDTCIDIDNNDTIDYYIDIVKDEMQDYPMLEIHLVTGTAWTKSILVEGTPHDDILQLIDEYYFEHDDLPVLMYTIDDLINGRIFKTQEEQWEYLDNLGVLPINGGEFYIDGIDHIEEVI
ncbi:MAG TPA: hypothetical protein VFC79_05255 [Tissierellaceae bacterium]|nr:hypothetical protein [Tissierellaceae bacterium]